MKEIKIIVCAILLTSCTHSVTEKDTEIETNNKIITQLQAELDSIKATKLESPPKAVSYFSAIDFNLTPGEVVAFAPTDEAVEGANSKGVLIDIYVHIKTESGLIKVMSIDYKGWLNLHPGDILK